MMICQGIVTVLEDYSTYKNFDQRMKINNIRHLHCHHRRHQLSLSCQIIFFVCLYIYLAWIHWVKVLSERFYDGLRPPHTHTHSCMGKRLITAHSYLVSFSILNIEMFNQRWAFLIFHRVVYLITGSWHENTILNLFGIICVCVWKQPRMGIFHDH